jgi:hypothetical protein
MPPELIAETETAKTVVLADPQFPFCRPRSAPKRRSLHRGALFLDLAIAAGLLTLVVLWASS